MEAILPRFWKEDFERAALDRREELAHKDRTARFEFAERQRKEQDRDTAEEKRDREEAAEIEVVLASQQQLAAFTVELDDYDTKTVEALMDNQEALAAVRDKIDLMLDQAEVLPDGRRVFKTRDGHRVFDEHGQELTRDAIDPSSIDDKAPKWEEFSGLTDEVKRLREEGRQLSDYQQKLDDARERLNTGEITESELKELRDDLKAEMPDAVRKKLEQDKPEPAADRKQDGPTAAMPHARQYGCSHASNRAWRTCLPNALISVSRHGQPACPFRAFSGGPENRLLQGKPCNLPASVMAEGYRDGEHRQPP